MEEIVAKEAKVKKEVRDEVAEVEVEAMVEVKVDEKVVKENSVELGESLRVFGGGRRVGSSGTCHGTPPSWQALTPQTLTTPSSSPRRVRFGLSVF